MKLTKVQITNFRSVEDSDEFDVAELTCLVGKNESGKSAVLEALYGLNPINSHSYDTVVDYPRRFYTAYASRHPEGKAKVVKTTWELDDQDIKILEGELGEGCILSKTITIENGFGYKGKIYGINIDEAAVLKKAARIGDCDSDETKKLTSFNSVKEAIKDIEAEDEPREALVKAIDFLKGMRDFRPTLHAIDTLDPLVPKFFITSHYDRMEGRVSVSDLLTKKKQNSLSPGERIFLDFLQYAGTSLEDLTDSELLEEETAKCEAASASITDEIFEYWSQNENISVDIRINAAKPKDPPPFNEGTVVNLRIHNAIHRASIPLNERSAGFVWFFSFLAQFKMLGQKHDGPVVLLLDEPGLTLHGKAQADLVRYIQERLLPNHQVLYTTHSPFLVPAQHLDQVRVVEDKVINIENERRPKIIGTKVSSDVLHVSRDTLFPLQSHLGYDLSQSLFLAKNTLLVEGPSDILYLQVASEMLGKAGRTSLNRHWAICPAGGIDKLMPFVSLFSGNNLNIVTLSDFAAGDKNKIQKLKQSQILEASQIFTTNDFTGKDESDIEDFFEPELYCKIVNGAYELSGSDKLTVKKLAEAKDTPRIVKQAEALFPTLSAEIPDFDHFTPARYLLNNPDILAGDSAMVTRSLERFENAFSSINSLFKD